MPAKKRTAAEAIATPESARGSLRKSGRLSSSGKRSNYFESNGGRNASDDVDELSGPRPRKAVKSETKTPRRRSKAKAESEDELQHEDENEDKDEDEDKDDLEDDGDALENSDDTEETSDNLRGDESESDAAPPVQKRGCGRPPKHKAGMPTKASRESDAKSRIVTKPKVKSKAKAKSDDPEAEEGSDDDDDDDENRITFIPAVQLRDTDGVDYEDTRIHKNTFLFLKDLKANNRRNWLKSNDGEYRRSLKDWESFVETLTEKIVETDETIPELPLKDVIFRIYRDIRFSKDPTPYKPHYSAAWSRTGRKGAYACYYVHVEPNRCMVGGGLWHPPAEALARLRASIDERPHRIRRVLMNSAFRKTFLPDAKANNEKSVLSAFAAANKENALKTKPKGFHPDHKDIELLKLRNYTIGKKIDDSDLLAEDAQDRIMDIITPMVEFVTFLNSVVMPDPNVDSDSEDAGGADDGGDGEEQDESDDA